MSGSERSISNLVCVLEPICNSVPVAVQHYFPLLEHRVSLPYVPCFFYTLSPFLSLFTLAHSNSVGDEAFPKGVFVCVRERVRERESEMLW